MGARALDQRCAARRRQPARPAAASASRASGAAPGSGTVGAAALVGDQGSAAFKVALAQLGMCQIAGGNGGVAAVQAQALLQLGLGGRQQATGLGKAAVQQFQGGQVYLQVQAVNGGFFAPAGLPGLRVLQPGFGLGHLAQAARRCAWTLGAAVQRVRQPLLQGGQRCRRGLGVVEPETGIGHLPQRFALGFGLAGRTSVGGHTLPGAARFFVSAR